MTPDGAAVPKNGSGIARRAVRWMILNRRTGGITVAQWPNISLSVFIILTIAPRLFHPLGDTETVLQVLAVVVLLVWAVDELIRGVNPFRRILGVAVLLATIANLAFH